MVTLPTSNGMYWTLKHILRLLLVLTFVGIIVFYAYYQSRAVVAGPEIVLATPLNGITSTTSLIEVRGVAIHAKELTLDGRGIFVDMSGNFAEKLLLQDGYNIIQLTANDGGGREVKKTIELIYIDPTPRRVSTSRQEIATTTLDTKVQH